MARDPSHGSERDRTKPTSRDDLCHPSQITRVINPLGDYDSVREWNDGVRCVAVGSAVQLRRKTEESVIKAGSLRYFWLLFRPPSLTTLHMLPPQWGSFNYSKMPRIFLSQSLFPLPEMLFLQFIKCSLILKERPFLSVPWEFPLLYLLPLAIYFPAVSNCVCVGGREAWDRGQGSPRSNMSSTRVRMSLSCSAFKPMLGTQGYYWKDNINI